MKKTFSNKQTIRFRKWSRKAYAMFASVGKCVTIGNVKKGIADASLGKQGNICALPVAWDFLSDYTEEEEVDTGRSPGNDILILNELYLQVVADDACCYCVFNRFKYTGQRCITIFARFFMYL